MAPEQAKWGVHEPLSTVLPTREELAKEEAMIEELKRQNNFEDQEETKRRTAILKLFRTITVQFIKEVGRKKGLGDKKVEELGGRITTFGSFRLGVFGPGSDIDALIVAPKHITRDDWFNHFPQVLERLSPEKAIEQIKLVRDSYVPIIKLEYSGIAIDLIFVSLNRGSVPEDLDLKDDSIVQDLNDLEVRCLNGTRVTDMILSVVPQTRIFRSALRVVKLWAQRRGIYANIAGFPGGVTWAMLVAFICQLYPQACGSVIVCKFFNIIRTWPWPRPIFLKKPTEQTPHMQHRVWNPVRNKSDQGHLMPVITPAYPEMCSTHNITRSTKMVICRELQRAEEIVTQIFEGKRPWSALFEKHTYFTRDFKTYLSIVASSKRKENHHGWAGLVESKVRRLAHTIEIDQSGIALARPFVRGFERVHICKDEDQVLAVLHGRMDYLYLDAKHSSKPAAGGDATEVNATAEDVATGIAENVPVERSVNGGANAGMQDEHGGIDQKNEANAEGKSQDSGIPKNDGENEAKTEDSKGETNGVSGHFNTIYTTTYYIGMELAKDRKSLDISYPVSDFMRQCQQWSDFTPDEHEIKVIHTRK